LSAGVVWATDEWLMLVDAVMVVVAGVVEAWSLRACAGLPTGAALAVAVHCGTAGCLGNPTCRVHHSINNANAAPAATMTMTIFRPLMV
jgi:hypothetical protein